MARYKHDIDMLENKQNVLDSYLRMTGSVIETTVNSAAILSDINEEIKKQISDIEKYQKELERVKEALHDTVSRNALVIKHLNSAAFE